MDTEGNDGNLVEDILFVGIVFFKRQLEILAGAIQIDFLQLAS